MQKRTTTWGKRREHDQADQATGCIPVKFGASPCLLGAWPNGWATAVNKDQVYCVLDYESYSEADLKKVGAFEYSVHPSTDIICAAWRIGTRETLRTAETHWWAPGLDSSGFGGLLSALKEANTGWYAPDPPGGDFQSLFSAFMEPDIILVAHNALFEQVITRNVFAAKHMYSVKGLKTIPSDRWLCTATLASALALPRNLEGAALALKLPVKKDMDGRRLILKWCKPRKPTKKSDKLKHDDPEELRRLIEYCKTDVAVETELFLKAPPLTANERKIWLLDQKINLRGFAVDRPLVTTILDMIDEETVSINERTVKLTGGALASATQRDAALNWLQEQGVFLPDLQLKTVENALSEGLATGDAKTLLEYRLAISKTSTAKYEAFHARSKHDGRLRDILVYHAASTGRWGGAGVQPQNFPRGTIKDTTAVAGTLAKGDLELVRMLYDDPMAVFSSCLRNMIVAPKGRVLDVADYAAIEARVLFWVAKHDAGMQAFRDGRDLYKELAATIFGIRHKDVNPSQRFVGKTAILGAGYGMGIPKFQITCKNQGQEVSEQLARAAINAYRSAHKPVVKLWSNIERAAIAAVENVGKKFTINRTSWWVKNDFLWCLLPSGRRLAYATPMVNYELPRWGGTEKIPVLYHYGVDSLSKKWVKQGTYGGRLVENVVQAIARDIMAEAMLRIDDVGIWDIVLTVHDELVAERDKDEGSIETFCQLMAEPPQWASDCPIAVEGWSGVRYRK